MQHLKNKGFTLVEIMVVVVIIGILVGLAIPGFTKVRSASQDKAVTNNLRLLGAAADQYFLESGLTQVSSAQLVGTGSTQFIKQVQTAALESYDATIQQGSAISASGVAGARTITYVY